MNLREVSRRDFGNDGSLTAVNVGSLQRIADACELMAKRHTDLIYERDQYKRWYEERGKLIESRDLQIRALKGQITKLKRRASEARP